MLKIRQLIKRIRACKTAEEERSVINKESAEIRNASKDPNAPHKARNLCKAIYMQMMGYQTSFMQLSCINLLASADFTEKRIAYSALSLVIDSTSQVLLLATSTIKKDLENKDAPDLQALALNAIGDVCTPDMCRELNNTVGNIIQTTNDSNVKKKAACAALVIIKKCPELIDTYVDKLQIFLEDRIHSVCLTGIELTLEMIKKKPEIIDKIKKYNSMFVRYEKALLSVSYSPEFDVNGLTDPFLQAKILEILQYTARGNKDYIEELGDLFVSVQSITEASKQTGYALQYEIIRTINNLKASAGMKSLSNNILGKFLSANDYNLKYIALNTLKDVAQTDLASVQKHKSLILDFLKDTDISLQKRALDLIYLIINKNNLKSIYKECIKFLPNATDEIKFELSKKLEDSVEKYAPSYKWEIDSLLKIVTNSKSKIYEDVLAKIINSLMRMPDLYLYIGHKAFRALQFNKENEALARVCFYLIGELGTYIVKNKILDYNNKEVSITEEQIISLIQEIGEINNKKGNKKVLEYLLNCLIKLSIKFTTISKDKIVQILKYFIRSYYAEVQERAAEYLLFSSSNKTQIKNKMVEPIPVPNEKEKDNDIIERERERPLTDEKDNDDLLEEDFNITVKLTEEPVKTKIINDNPKQDKNNNNNPLDFLNNDGNNNDNTNKQNNDALNLLDLNSIFSNMGANNNNNPTVQNNQSNDLGNILAGIKNSNNNINNNNNNINNNNNNNQSGNPFANFDLLNCLTNNNNQANTNNTQSNDSNQNLNNILDIISGSSNTNQTNAINAVKEECFKNDEITIHYEITKKTTDSLEGSIYASNNKDVKLDDVKISFLVQKFVKLNVLNTSGTTLEPSKQFGIKKDFTLKSSDPNKKIAIKLRIHYSVNGEERSNEITLKNL